MILWRLTQDHAGLMEGSCITEAQYKELFYLHRPLYEPISEEDRKGMVEVEEKSYCAAMGIECMLFYSWIEMEKFVNKVYDVSILN